jgi:hypothetical protein
MAIIQVDHRACRPKSMNFFRRTSPFFFFRPTSFCSASWLKSTKACATSYLVLQWFPSFSKPVVIFINSPIRSSSRHLPLRSGLCGSNAFTASLGDLRHRFVQSLTAHLESAADLRQRLFPLLRYLHYPVLLLALHVLPFHHLTPFFSPGRLLQTYTVHSSGQVQESQHSP